MSKDRKKKISQLWVNPGPALIFAEAGVNHNGDMGLAFEMIEVAADSGADVVKFQTFKAERYISRVSPQADYQKQNTGTDIPMLELMKKLEIGRADHEALIGKCHDCGILFASSVFEEDAPGLLDELDVPFIKIPSGEVPNLRLLRIVAEKGRPIILSTGMSGLAEVAIAVETIRDAGDPDLALLQCTSDYPSRAEDANLKAMATMRSAFSVPVGYSDHTIGCEVACAAIALGACILEKHFTMSRDLAGPDHAASIDPDGFAEYVRSVRNVEASLGSAIKAPTKADRITARVARKSLTASSDLSAGHVICEKDITVKRPGTGIPAERFDWYIGRTLAKDVQADALFEEEFFV